MKDEISLKGLWEKISIQRRIVNEFGSLSNYLGNAESQEERKMVGAQIESLRMALLDSGKRVIEIIGNISLLKPLSQEAKPEEPEGAGGKIPEQINAGSKAEKASRGKRTFKPGILENLTLKRMKKKGEKIVVRKEKRPSKYIKISSKMFYNLSNRLLSKGLFNNLKRDLIRANLEFVPASYMSMVFFSTLLSFAASFFVVLFFLFFNFVATPPFFIPAEESLGSRFLKLVWIFIAIPTATFFFGYFYPSLEKRAAEGKINQELPFAVIHMSSISSSMIEPSKIFSVIISTKEYPALEKEFIKLQNEINIYGYDLVTALKNRSANSPSKKLAELFNGLATTINSGGDLPEFFAKRAQTLLFEHRLDVEKQTKASETFMDIYISAVIAAPMILMLLLIMMRISGLGISLSASMISLIMVLGVSLINILFLAFLQIKQPEAS